MLTFLTMVLVAVEIICSLLLIGVILIQKTKSQGMGMAFGSGMGESLFGSQVGNVLTKTTVILGIIFLLNTTMLAILGAKRTVRSVADGITTSPVPTQVPATTDLPAMPMPQTANPEGMDEGAASVPLAIDIDTSETVAE